MLTRDAGWAALAATGFLMLCAFSIWGDLGPDGARPAGHPLRQRPTQTSHRQPADLAAPTGRP